MFRVSSREQETGFSLDAQKKLLVAYAEKQEFTISKIFLISESASGKEQHKIFKTMLTFIEEKNIQVIVCEKVDMLTRNKYDAVEIDKWINKDPERQAHFIKENFILTKESRSHDKFLWSIKVSVAQFYTDNLSEEVRKGQEEKLKQGWYPGQARLGYNTVENEGRRIPIPNEPTASLIKKALELFATSNYSVKKLTDTMYAEGLRSRQGNKVVTSRMYDLLTDPFYYGYFEWKGDLYSGKHQPLITKEVFDKNQSLLKRKNAPKYTIHNYLLKGLSFCSECHGSITWELQKSTLYGYCNHVKPCSQVKSVKEPDIEGQLIDYLHFFQINNRRISGWIRKAVKEGHIDEVDYHEEIIKDLNKKLEHAQKRIDNLVNMRVDEQIDKENYDKKFKEFKKEKADILEAIKKHSDQEVKSAEFSISFYDLSQRAKDIYTHPRRKDEEKRSLMRQMFASLHVDPNSGKIICELTLPFKRLSELA
ncbi:MAG: recombinase family protein [Patescibacteria group bacterium]|nr:recombinase family protein [Patescibacteria group bacterium]